MKKNQKTTLPHFIKYILIAFMSLVILMNAYLAISKALTNNPAPQVFGVTPFIVLSGSMEPTIMPGDLVIIRAQNIDKYKAGDVATYLEDSAAYTHRIIAEEGGMFVFKGDNNNVADDKVASSQLMGKVILRIPKIGLAILFLKTPLGMFTLLLLFLLIIYGEEIWLARGK